MISLQVFLSLMENYPEFPFTNLNYAGGHAWPPDLHFGRQKQNLVAQATILVDNIEL